LDDVILRLPDSTSTRAGELTKSGRTRRRILDAAIACLAEEGYAGTNTGAVAIRAGMTRPAMLYHFPSKAALIEAVVYHIMRVRLDLYLQDVQTLENREDMVDMAWGHLQTKVFRAFTELLVVAQTDEDLAAVFGPALAEYDRARRDVSLATLPKAEAEAPWFNLRRDIFRFLLEGLAMQGGMSFDAERRRLAILNFAKVLFYGPVGETVFSEALERMSSRRTAGARKVVAAEAPDALNPSGDADRQDDT
jgi:AcrR family transcriptional regulator